MNALRILLVENIHAVAKEALISEGFKVDLISHAPSEEELLKTLPNYDVIGIRSKTEMTEKVIKNNSHLLAVGCFCIGTNQVDLGTARAHGVPVFNAPHSNTRSVAELVIAEMISLSRQLGDRNMKAHMGDWLKSADGSREVRGKTIGIVGYGHIGSQVSVLAEAMGMKVVFFDIVKKLSLGNAVAKSSLEDLLKVSDFVTLHVPETPETKDMIGANELSLMKKGSYLINASRGTVVVIESLVESLKSKHLAGCAIDVFPTEPSSNKEKFVSPLQGVSNVILTPHIGGSTEEAQYAIGLEVAESFRRYLKIGSTAGAVNFPNVDLPVKHGTSRILNVHRNEPGVLGEINSLISKTGANIEAQYLSTDEKIGYLVMDVHSAQAGALAQDIEKLHRSIRTRVVY
ncbi:MAG: phosphoglycerate dehydrogenase [Pseudobdellovibrionaceae bacterium]